MRRPADLEGAAVTAALAELLELCGMTSEDWARDVLSIHVTRGTVALRTVGRGPRGKLLPGVTIRRAHRILAELPEVAD